jgi:hypothetical protein
MQMWMRVRVCREIMASTVAVRTMRTMRIIRITPITPITILMRPLHKAHTAHTMDTSSRRNCPPRGRTRRTPMPHT